MRQFLKKRNYNLLETNYRTKFGEIDIIEVKQSDTIFPKSNLQSLKK